MNRYLRRALWRHLSSQLRWDWNPASWIKGAESAADDLKHDIDDVWHWVITEAAKLGTLVWHDVDNVWGGVNAFAASLWNFIDTVILPAINAGVGTVLGDVANIYHWVLREIHSIVNAAVADLRTFGWAIWHTANDWYHDAEKAGRSYVEWFYDHVVRPVVNTLWAGIRDAERYTDNLWHDFDTDVWRRLEHDVTEAWADAKTALYWIEHGGDDAYHLVVRCWDFLEIVASRPQYAAEQIIAAWETDFTAAAGIAQAKTAEGYFTRLVDSIEGAF